MHRLFQRVFQRVRGRERGKVGQHDVFQANRGQHRLENGGAFFQLGCNEKEETDHGQPDVPQHSDQHEEGCKCLADGYGAARGADQIHAAAKQGTKYAAAVHGIGRQQVEKRDPDIGPEQAARQVARKHVRFRPELNFRRYTEQDATGDKSNQQIN